MPSSYQPYAFGSFLFSALGDALLFPYYAIDSGVQIRPSISRLLVCQTKRRGTAQGTPVPSIGFSLASVTQAPPPTPKLWLLAASMPRACRPATHHDQSCSVTQHVHFHPPMPTINSSRRTACANPWESLRPFSTHPHSPQPNRDCDNAPTVALHTVVNRRVFAIFHGIRKLTFPALTTISHDRHGRPDPRGSSALSTASCSRKAERSATARAWDHRYHFSIW